MLTHDRISLSTGVLTASKGILWGLNALQSITIGRHTPRDPQQAIGFLGIVDYTSGVITSDVSLDTILVEGCNKADTTATKNTSAYKYAAKNITIGSESYVLTSAAVQFNAGSPATANFGWLTSGLASYLDVQAAPTPSEGEEDNFCVVLGDDGTGIRLAVTWYDAGITLKTGNIPVINAAGALVNKADVGIPAGVQSVGFNSSINRDQILDIRTTSPVQFVTTYPLDVTLDMEVYQLPVESTVERQNEVGFDVATFQHQMRNLKDISVEASDLTKHITGGATAATTGDTYVKAVGLRQVDETEGMQVGRYQSFNFSFLVADLLLPLPSAA